MLRFATFIVTVLILTSAQAQMGENTYEFLNLPVSARVTALGGKVAALDDNDPSLVYMNPSLLTTSMDKQLSLNYTGYFEGIKYGYASYAYKKDSIQTLAAGIQYTNYGDFIEANETGLITGKFSAADYILNITYSRQLDSNWSVGTSIKPILSDYTYYMSAGLCSDLGLRYSNNEGGFIASITIRNAGIQLKTYTGNGQEPLPFEIIAGFSQKLKYAPFRFVVTLQQLQQFDLSYTLPDQSTKTNKSMENKNTSKIEKFANNALKHAIAGIEFTPTKSFFASFALNFKRRAEMKILDSPGLVGFSFGLGVKVSKFRLTYGSSKFHAAGSYNVFSLSTNLSEFNSRNR